MSDKIQINFSDFNKATNNIGNAINEIGKVHQDLKNCNERLKSSWEGQSKKKYYTQYDRIANKFTDYTEGLKSMVTDLNEIVEYFKELEERLIAEIMKNKIK